MCNAYKLVSISFHVLVDRCYLLRPSIDIPQTRLDLVTDIVVIIPRMNIHIDFEVDGSLKEVRELYVK